MADDVDLDRRKRPGTPEEFKSSAEFLSDMRTRYAKAQEADADNRHAAQEDIQFTYGKQWDDQVRKKRVERNKPVLTINRMPAFVAQVINDRLQNETEIRVMADRDGTKELAEVREGLIRAIFKNSLSDFARDEAMKYQVIGGLGWFTLDLEYNDDEVFDQDIVIRPLANPFAAILDENSVEPSGEDATHGWVEDSLDREVFKQRYPWASTDGFAGDGKSNLSDWYDNDRVKIVSYWRMLETGVRTLVLLADTTVKILESSEELEQLAEAGLLWLDPQTQQPKIREVPVRVARKYICSGADILEGPYDLPISRIPIFRVPGWEIRDGETYERWGLVRFMKDPQRLYNFWRSFIAEQLTAAPRSKWVGTEATFAGRESAWEQSVKSDDPLLIYNSDGITPSLIPPPPTDEALITEAGMAEKDMRDVSNIQEAALGAKSNEVSGRALEARQQMVALGVFHYADRVRIAEESCAKVCNQLIPHVFDATRTVMYMGIDDKAVQVVINDPAQPNSDVTVGKYKVTVGTGPAMATRRQLAREQMETFVHAMPESAAVVLDLVAEAQDWPKSSEFAQRFKTMLPPGMIPTEELSEEMQNQRQVAAQLEQAQQELQSAAAQAEIMTKQAEAQERMARAEQLKAQAAKLLADAETRRFEAANKAENNQATNLLKTAEFVHETVKSDREQDAIQRSAQEGNQNG